ncbi:MAG TPA: DUF1697 domain-containing protein [Solirubrobacteraceae bacterium]|nr:DUF1697 domain-containing protein [Solirubrobacteraceae bacterium]
MKQIALLRGVNVGGRNRVAMPALREALEDAGLTQARTYLQSGNVVVESAASPEKLARECERVIAARFALDIDVVVRTRDELAKIVRHDPLGALAANPKLYQVSFCSAEPQERAVRKVGQRAVGEERLLVHGREIYTWFPDGVGRSRLAAALSRQSLGVTVTARNWTTVVSLLALADE